MAGKQILQITQALKLYHIKESLSIGNQNFLKIQGGFTGIPPYWTVYEPPELETQGRPAVARRHARRHKVRFRSGGLVAAIRAASLLLLSKPNPLALGFGLGFVSPQLLPEPEM